LSQRSAPAWCRGLSLILLLPVVLDVAACAIQPPIGSGSRRCCMHCPAALFLVGKLQPPKQEVYFVQWSWPARESRWP